jgi:hypothetical protein
LTEEEEKAVDGAIEIMVRLFRRRRITVKRPRYLNDEKEACKAIDKLLAETLTNLKREVPVEPAEKLFDRLGKISMDCKDDDEAWTMGCIFIRFMDTMNYMVSFKRKYRGRERKHVQYTKKEALDALRERGLTRK